MQGMPGCKVGPVPIMRMFGINDNGNSICCHVHGFCPYFYVTAPSKFTSSDTSEFMVIKNKIFKFFNFIL